MKHILISPLDWGLGHATRCTVIVDALLKQGFKVSVAADDHGLQLFEEAFQNNINYIESIPNYNINYQGKSLALSLARQIGQIRSTIRNENDWLHKISPKLQLDGIISDNRFGLYHDLLPSVYISHQLSVRSYGLELLSGKLHARIIRNYKECWVPDNPGKRNLSGKLSHGSRSSVKPKYIGLLNRFELVQALKPEQDIAVMVISSGPEPQRSSMVSLALSALKDIPGNHLILGAKKGEVVKESIGNVDFLSHASAKAMKGYIENADVILCRPGYTSLMELASFNKQVIVVPTPGQTEQEYLARKHAKVDGLQMIKQSKLSPEILSNGLKEKTSFSVESYTPDWEKVFKLFQD